MVRIIKLLLKEHREFFLYCIIGVSGVTLDYAVYFVLTYYTGMYYQVANACSVSCGICNNYFLNAFFNFKRTDRMFLRFLSFYSVGLLGLACSAAMLLLFVECCGINDKIAKIIIIFIVTILQFSLNKLLTFRKGKQS